MCSTLCSDLGHATAPVSTPPDVPCAVQSPLPSPQLNATHQHSGGSGRNGGLNRMPVMNATLPTVPSNEQLYRPLGHPGGAVVAPEVPANPAGARSLWSMSSCASPAELRPELHGEPSALGNNISGTSHNGSCSLADGSQELP